LGGGEGGGSNTSGNNPVELSLNPFRRKDFWIYSTPNILFDAGRGRTLFELEQLMGEPAANSSRRYSRLAANLATLPAAGPLELRMANLAALATGFTPRPEYRRLLETLFQTRVEVMDFAGNPVGSVERINSFIDRNTGGQIPRMLTPRQGTKKKYFLSYMVLHYHTLYMLLCYISPKRIVSNFYGCSLHWYRCVTVLLPGWVIRK
jgi:hypothetical protein